MLLMLRCRRCQLFFIYAADAIDTPMLISLSLIFFAALALLSRVAAADALLRAMPIDDAV